MPYQNSQHQLQNIENGNNHEELPLNRMNSTQEGALQRMTSTQERCRKDALRQIFDKVSENNRRTNSN